MTQLSEVKPSSGRNELPRNAPGLPRLLRDVGRPLSDAGRPAVCRPVTSPTNRRDPSRGEEPGPHHTHQLLCRPSRFSLLADSHNRAAVTAADLILVSAASLRLMA